jgi:hypothetical protein
LGHRDSLDEIPLLADSGQNHVSNLVSIPVVTQEHLPSLTGKLISPKWLF